MHVGDRMREVRKERGFTAEALAVAIGMGSQAVLRWERGKVSPRLDQLAQVAEALGTSVLHLLANVTDFSEKTAA